MLAAALASAQGGPPLLTDDPGTVDPGKWEVNISWVNRTFPGRIENELPHLDASHGFTGNAQYKIEAPWVFASGDGRSANGDGGGSTGIKWRFVNAKGARPAVSTYPQIGFSIAPRSVRLGLSDGGTSLLLPIEVEWDLSRLSVNADFGALIQAGSGPGWMGGIAVGHEVGSTEYLAEIHGEGTPSDRESLWVAQVGMRHDFGKRATLLVAFGRSFAGTETDPIRWTSYLGIQLHY